MISGKTTRWDLITQAVSCNNKRSSWMSSTNVERLSSSQIRSIISYWTTTRASWGRRSRWTERRWRTRRACSRWSWRPASWSTAYPAMTNWRYRRPRRPWRLRTSMTSRPRSIGASTTSRSRRTCRTARRYRIWIWRWKTRMWWAQIRYL